MNNFTVAITTFSKRFNYLENLVKQVREFTNHDILIAINGDYKEKFNDSYRKKVLSLCLKYENVFPIFFPEQRSLSKLWNTLIIHSKTDWCLVLNEDIEIMNSDIFEFGANLLDEPDLTYVNGSFSHFFVHKKIIDDLGYFDERLLGFGEEDGDIFFRYIEKYNKWMKNSYIGGLNDLRIDIRDEKIKSGTGKYSAFNKDFCFNIQNCKYVPDENGIVGTFSVKMKKNIPDINLYPYEKFFMDNKHKL